MTPSSPFVPIVHDLGIVLDETLLRNAEMLGKRATSMDFDPTVDTYPTSVHGLYACPMPVSRHQDLSGAEPGMLVRGLVLRSDGHRLHSDRLTAAGRPEGIPLEKGSFYELDPYDFHWTTVPDGPKNPMLLFYIEGDLPDRRTSRDIVEGMLAHLDVEVPSMSGRSKSSATSR